MNCKVGKSVDTPLVSIITPAYNSASFISDTIRSIQQQTYTNWELIIADDRSYDETKEIVQQFMENDDRIHLLSLPRNSGAAAARNAAMETAKGTYIAFLDSDDTWKPEKLEAQLSFMRANNIAFSFTGYALMDEQGNKVGIEIHAPAIVSYEMLAGNTIIGCLTVMLDRDKIGEVRMPDMKPEDTALWLSILRQGYKAYGMPDILAHYRIAQGSVSRNKIKAAIRYWTVLRTQEKMNWIRSSMYFMKYAVNAYNKNKRGFRA